jgi:hypothetical protein
MVDLPGTGHFQSWETAVLSGVEVPADGEHVLRVEAVGGHINIDWTRFVPTATPTPTPTETPTPTPTVTPSTSWGTQGYGEYGYGGVDE